MSTNDVSKTNAEATPESARRPYRRPELRRLGSVREVTWGNPTSGADGPFNLKSTIGGKMM